MNDELSVPCVYLERLLADSRTSTLTELDELCFLRLAIRCMASGLSYSEAMEVVTRQLIDQINSGE
jgi:hypothetical protein